MTLRGSFARQFQKEYPGFELKTIADFWITAIRERVEMLRKDKERHLCAFNDGDQVCACMERTLDVLLSDLK